MTARGGVIAHWRDDLENLVSDGEERVAESEHLDVGVAVAQLQTEFLGDTGLHRRQIMGDQCDLAKSHPHAPTVAGSYARAPDRLHRLGHRAGQSLDLVGGQPRDGDAYPR